LNAEIQKLFQLILNIVKIGIVKRYNPEGHTAVVEFKDFESVISRELQVVEPFTYQNKSYMPLREGQKVLCLLLPQSGTTDGFIIGTVYDVDNPPLIEDRNKFNITFEDGTVIEYDTENRKLILDAKGQIEIVVSGDATLTSSGKVSIKGAGTVEIDGGSGATQKPIHDASPCPLFGVCHLMPSETIKISP